MEENPQQSRCTQVRPVHRFQMLTGVLLQITERTGLSVGPFRMMYEKEKMSFVDINAYLATGTSLRLFTNMTTLPMVSRAITPVTT